MTGDWVLATVCSLPLFLAIILLAPLGLMHQPEPPTWLQPVTLTFLATTDYVLTALICLLTHVEDLVFIGQQD